MKWLRSVENGAAKMGPKLKNQDNEVAQEFEQNGLDNETAKACRWNSLGTEAAKACGWNSLGTEATNSREMA